MISVGVRLTVTDKPKTGRTPNRLLGTQNGATLKDNIATVGMRAFPGLPYCVVVVLLVVVFNF